MDQALTASGPTLECGSGLPSIAAGAISKNRGNEHCTLEHSADWAEKVENHLRRHRIDSVHLCIYQIALGNSPLRANILRNLTFTDWSQGRSSSASISDEHIEPFEEASRTLLNDVYGTGEALFARKFSDQSEHLVDDLDLMVEARGEQ